MRGENLNFRSCLCDPWKPLIILPNWLDASTLAPFTRFRYGTSKCDRRNWKSRNRVETKSSCENPKNFSHIKNPCEKIPRREFNPVTAWKSSESSFQSASASRFFWRRRFHDERRKLNRQDVELGGMKMVIFSHYLPSKTSIQSPREISFASPPTLIASLMFSSATNRILRCGFTCEMFVYLPIWMTKAAD